MTDINLFSRINAQLQVNGPDWLELAKWNNDGDYDPDDKKNSTTAEMVWLKNDPIDPRSYEEQAGEPTSSTTEHKRKFRSRAESRMVQPPSSTTMSSSWSWVWVGTVNPAGISLWFMKKPA